MSIYEASICPEILFHSRICSRTSKSILQVKAVVVVAGARVVVTITGARVVVGGLVVVSTTVTIGVFVATGVLFSVVVEQETNRKIMVNNVALIRISKVLHETSIRIYT